MQHDPDALARRKQLMKDLDRIAQLHYRRAFEPEPADVPCLAKVVQARYGGIMNVDTLHDTLLSAVEEALSPTERPPNVDATYRQLGHMLFLNALPDDELSRYEKDERGKRYSKVLALITPLIRDATEKSRQLLVREIRSRMADYLLHEASQQPDGKIPTAQNRTYINRPALETAVSEALKDKSRPVVLWGPSGNGKSTLVRYLTGMMPPKTVVVLRGPVVRGAQFEEDLNEALDRYGIRRDSQLLGEKLRALANLPASGAELGAIVLDNVTPGSIDVTSLAQGRVPVIVTSRERFPEAGHQLIRVGEYQPEEAEAAAEAIMESPPTDKRTLLLRLLGRRPIAVNIACRLLANTEVSIEELLRACVDDAGEALDAGSVLLDHSPPAVETLYGELVRTLQPERLAMAVLKVIVWVVDYPELAVIGKLVEALCDVLGSDFRTSAAVEKLEILGVVERQGDTLAINELSLNVLRVVLADDADTILRAVYRHVASLPDFAPETPWEHLSLWWRYSNYIAAKQLRLATGKYNCGAFPLNLLQVLVWQTDGTLFPSDSTELEVALVDHRYDDKVLYYKGRRREPHDPFVFSAFHALTFKFNPLICEIGSRLRPLQLEAQSPPSVDHIPLSQLPDRNDRSQLRWAWCGSPFWSTASMSPNLPPCEACERSISQADYDHLWGELIIYWTVARELGGVSHSRRVAELILGSFMGVLMRRNTAEDIERAKWAASEMLPIDFQGFDLIDVDGHKVIDHDVRWSRLPAKLGQKYLYLYRH